MIIRVVLIVLMCALLLWFLRQRFSTRAQAWNKIGSLGLFVLAVLAILFPDSTNELAHHVGVGRGADLLLYFLIVAFFLSLLLQYMHRQEDQERLASLARRIAITEANQRYNTLKAASHAQTSRHAR